MKRCLVVGAGGHGHSAWKAITASAAFKLMVSTEHAVPIAGLPPIHKNPFDRILVAQAALDGNLLSMDIVVAQYPDPVRHVG